MKAVRATSYEVSTKNQRVRREGRRNQLATSMLEQRGAQAHATGCNGVGRADPRGVANVVGRLP